MAEPQPSVKNDLFKGIKFFLADESNEKVKQLLRQGGASREFFVSSLATHIVSSSTDFVEYELAKGSGIPIVKPDWVKMSVICGAVLPPSAFSPEKNKLFSDVVACPSQIPVEDRDALWAMITFYGGRCQATLDSTCTHLLVPKPEGDKYKCALEHSGKVKIVIPDWIVDSIKAKTMLDESKYVPVQTKLSQSILSECILTPDHQGGTTGAVLNTNVKVITETPSSLLSPESPSESELNKESDNDNSKESESAPKEIQELDSNDNEQNNKDSDRDQLSKKKGRLAAQAAKERLRNVPGLDTVDVNDKDVNYDDEVVECVLAVEGNPKKVHQVIEISDQGNESVEELSEDSSSNIVVSDLLAGCIFFIMDYTLCLEPKLLRKWTTVIKQHGGSVVLTYSSTSCTHVLCMHQFGEYYTEALSDGKYLVTAYWLNDVVRTNMVFAPKIPLHLPVPFRDKISRCRNMIISVTGFEGPERRALKNMIHLIGSKYTGYLSRSNTHLICRSMEGDKYKKAKEWGVYCTNARWLGDVVTGGCDYPVNMKRYHMFSGENELDINIILARELLEVWKGFEEKGTPVPEAKKRKLETPESEVKEHETKKAKIDEPAQTSVANEKSTSAPSARVVFTGLDHMLVRHLTELLRALGGEPADSVKSCTHIVASKIMRTIKFLTGISVCPFIVDPVWIEESFRNKHYLDEEKYILRDHESEKLYGMSLPKSIKKAQAKPLFKDMTIYVTPNVRPDQKSMAEIVGCGGGKLLNEMPALSSFKTLAEQKTDQGRPAFLCVSCNEDLHLCKDMDSQGIGIHNVEFVLSGILKQELDFHRYKFEDLEDAICNPADR